MEKKTLYNEILMLVEDELYQRKNPRHMNDNLHTVQNIIQTGGSPNILNNGSTYVIPGKFDIVRNSFNLTLEEAINGTRQRQQLFSDFIKSITI